MADISRPKNAKIITIDWLNELEVMILDREDDFNFFVKEHCLEDEPFADDWKVANGSMGVFERDGIPYFVLVFPTKDQRVIVHECVHMAQAIMEHMGIELGPETSEVIAYMTDYLYSQVNQAI